MQQNDSCRYLNITLDENKLFLNIYKKRVYINIYIQHYVELLNKQLIWSSQGGYKKNKKYMAHSRDQRLNIDTGLSSAGVSTHDNH